MGRAAEVVAPSFDRGSNESGSGDSQRSTIARWLADIKGVTCKMIGVRPWYGKYICSSWTTQ
jgi:hypothetical protein